MKKFTNASSSPKNHSSLAFRLSVWFFILSMLPLVVMMVFIRGNISERFHLIEVEIQQRRTKELALFISQQSSEQEIMPVLMASSSSNKHYLVIDPVGNIQIATDENLLLNTIPDFDLQMLIREINNQIDGFILNLEKRELITFTPIPHQNRFLICIQKNPPILNVVSSLETQSFIQLGASLVIISIIAGIIIWFIVGQPIKELTEAALKIGEGDFETSLDLENMNDELQVLATTFNHMTAKLKETIHGLENNLQELEEAQETIRTSETRYRSIFDTASVSIWEEDVTELFQLFQELKQQGVTNLRKFLDENPDFLFKAMSAVKVLDANNETIRMYGAKSKQELLGPLEFIYLPDMIEDFKEELVAIFNGATEYETEISNLTLQGKKIETIMRLTIPDLNSANKKMLVSMMDITEQKLNSARIQKQVEHLSALRQVDLAITSHLDLRNIINLLLSLIRKQLNVDAANVLQFNPYLNSLEYLSSMGFRTEALQNTRLRLGEGFAGKAALERVPLFIPDLDQIQSPFDKAPYFSMENFISYYGVPLIAKGEIKGVMEIFHRSPLTINAEWEEFVNDLATQGALAIEAATLWEEQRRTTEELKLAYDNTLKGWSSALELHDHETFGHSDRVTNLTVELAQKMGIAQDKLIHIRRGAILHDIGKMGIPDSILNKTEKLTDQDWEKIRKHPLYAKKLLDTIEYLKPATDIPYYHHEWWNGGGYPEGLERENIPIAARIFAVIDVWDALSNTRPYREAWPEEKVLQYIQDLSGIQFDPRVVEAFLQLIQEKNNFPSN